MTIPGRGDLAPPHRHTPIGRYVTVLVVVALLAGGGYAAYQGLSGGSGTNAGATVPLCAKGNAPKKLTLFARRNLSKVDVYNASLITGLASQVATELKHRGFKVGTIGNAPAVGKGVATVRYSADRKLEATKLGSEVKGAQLVPVAGTHIVELDINPKFTALQSKSAAAAAFRLAVVNQHLATATPTPTPSRSCRARS